MSIDPTSLQDASGGHLVDYELVRQWQQINRDLMKTCDGQSALVNRTIEGLQKAVDMLDAERDRHDATAQRLTKVENRVHLLAVVLVTLVVLFAVGAFAL